MTGPGFRIPPGYSWRVLELFSLQSGIMLLLFLVLFVVKCVAVVDCVTRDESQFRVVDTLPKRTWLILLVLAVLVHLIDQSPIGILNLAGTVAALVYLAQMRGSNH